MSSSRTAWIESSGPTVIGSGFMILRIVGTVILRGKDV